MPLDVTKAQPRRLVCSIVVVLVVVAAASAVFSFIFNFCSLFPPSTLDSKKKAGSTIYYGQLPLTASAACAGEENGEGGETRETKLNQ